jgi:XTP/dITP diphosphohydrolase
MAGMTERAAYFVCCLVLVHGENRFLVAQETVDGVIADAPRGRNGFGYDPLFFFPAHGRTMAELSDAEKDSVSHRGRAARRMIALLRADD